MKNSHVQLIPKTVKTTKEYFFLQGGDDDADGRHHYDHSSLCLITQIFYTYNTEK